MPQDDDDEEFQFQSIMAEERNRGVRRKRHDSEERRKTQKTKADLARVLAAGDERAFMKIMREIGLKDDSPEFLKALKTSANTRGGARSDLVDFLPRCISCGGWQLRQSLLDNACDCP